MQLMEHVQRDQVVSGIIANTGRLIRKFRGRGCVDPSALVSYEIVSSDLQVPMIH
jgi:hypothetical protein